MRDKAIAGISKLARALVGPPDLFAKRAVFSLDSASVSALDLKAVAASCDTDAIRITLLDVEKVRQLAPLMEILSERIQPGRVVEFVNQTPLVPFFRRGTSIRNAELLMYEIGMWLPSDFAVRTLRAGALGDAFIELVRLPTSSGALPTLSTTEAQRDATTVHVLLRDGAQGKSDADETRTSMWRDQNRMGASAIVFAKEDTPEDDVERVRTALAQQDLVCMGRPEPGRVSDARVWGVSARCSAAVLGRRRPEPNDANWCQWVEEGFVRYGFWVHELTAANARRSSKE